MNHFSYHSILHPYAHYINQFFNETKLNLLLPKNVAVIRALATTAFTTLSALQLSDTMFYWPTCIVGAAFSGWTIYSISKDSMMEPFYQILGGRNHFEQLPEINLMQNPNEKIADAIAKINWENLKERIYRSNTSDGQSIVLIKNFKDHNQMQGVLAFIEKAAPSPLDLSSHKHNLPFEVTFHPLNGNHSSKRLEHRIELQDEDYLERDVSSDKAQEIGKQIASKINNCQSFKYLLELVENGPIIKEEIVCLNSKNWTQWFNRLEKLSIQPPNRERVENIIQKMLIQIPLCPSDQCSQIAIAAGNLGIVSEGLANWVFKNSMGSLSSLDAKKFYMMIRGAGKLLKASDLHNILTSYSDMLAKNEITKTNFINQLPPEGIACILRAYAKVDWKTSYLSDLLLEQAKLRLKRFDCSSKIDLIAGLSFYAYKDSDVVKLLQQIESDLTKMADFPVDSLCIAMSHFARCGFVPSEVLLSKVKAFLENSETSVWNRISLLHSLATLEITEEFSTSFDQLIQLINELDQNNKKRFKEIYPRDLIRFLYAVVVFSQEQNEPHLVIAEIVDHLMLKFKQSSLAQQDLYRLITPLFALGYFEQGKEISKGVIQSTFLSKIQIEVMNGIKDYLNEKISSKKASVLSKGDLKGIKVDVLIILSGTGKGRSYPIAIELHAPFYWACNKPDHLLGQNTLRSLALKKTNCTWESFDLRKGAPKVIEEVIDYLRKKNL